MSKYESKKLEIMEKIDEVKKSIKKCCRGGDVRGMCFTCIGDLSQMTANDILDARKCPHTSYAIAYWIYNNQDDLELMLQDKYLQLIVNSTLEGFQGLMAPFNMAEEIEAHYNELKGDDADDGNDGTCCQCKDTDAPHSDKTGDRFCHDCWKKEDHCFMCGDTNCPINDPNGMPYCKECFSGLKC